MSVGCAKQPYYVDTARIKTARTLDFQVRKARRPRLCFLHFYASEKHEDGASFF